MCNGSLKPCVSHGWAACHLAWNARELSWLDGRLSNRDAAQGALLARVEVTSRMLQLTIVPNHIVTHSPRMRIGKAFTRAAADRWADAYVTAGADREVATRTADATFG